MNPFYQGISLLFYSFFAYFFWIRKLDELAVLTIFIFVAFSLLKKELRRGLPFLFVVSIIHLVGKLCSWSPYLQWPIDFFVATGVGVLAVKWLLRQSLPEMGWKVALTRYQIFSALLISACTLPVLVWYYATHKEVAQQWPLPDLPTWSLPGVILLFAGLNGLREELLFRGFLQTQSSQYFSPWFVVLFQALFFGSLHFSGGFPQGWIGVCLTALWGGALAIQFHFFKSLRLAWLTHSMADAIMFAIILMNR